MEVGRKEEREGEKGGEGMEGRREGGEVGVGGQRRERGGRQEWEKGGKGKISQ